MLLTHPTFLPCFSVPILFPQIVCPTALSTYLLVEFFSLSWNVLFVCIVWPCFSFKSPFFRQYLIFPIMLYCSTCVLFCFCLFIPTYFHVFPFLNIFTCFRNFFTYDSSLISHPSFYFQFVFLRGTPTLLLTNFAPA